MEKARVQSSPGFSSGRRVSASKRRSTASADDIKHSVNKLLRRELSSRANWSFKRTTAEEKFRNFWLQDEFDTFDPSAVQFQKLQFLKKRSRIVEIVAAQGLVFALAHSGACAAYNRGVAMPAARPPARPLAFVLGMDRWTEGSINVSNILTGKCVAKIRAPPAKKCSHFAPSGGSDSGGSSSSSSSAAAAAPLPAAEAADDPEPQPRSRPGMVTSPKEALEDVTALFYDEERNEIYTGNRLGFVHVWTN
eukprot:jgi/Mesen1/2116/ME001515S01332